MSTVALEEFQRDGFAMIPDFLAAGKCEEISRELDMLWTSQRQDRPGRGGLRNLLQHSRAVAVLANDPALQAILQRILGGDPFPVRSLLFDKTPEANWAVAWHQDVHIAVAERAETPGFGPWSVKAGVVHVQPPAEVLEQMVTVRLHLDDCDNSNGALRVIAGSHVHGVLADTEVDAWRRHEAVICSVPKGGLLLMRPLLLHASSSATRPGHRRVLHLEYACQSLPNGLRWHERQ
jgi:ectoine hydroxylase-related dioxygenase (phytanoyl-CoA dioxygenase family)